MVCYDNDVLQCAARRQNPGPRRGTQGHTAQYSKYSTARCRCRRYPRNMGHIPLDPGSTRGAAITLASRPEKSPSRPMPASWVRRR